MTSINGIAKSARLSTGFGIAAVCGAAAVSVGLMQATAADRLVDGRYDQAIAVVGSLNEPVIGRPGLLRLATQPVNVARPLPPTAATEHAWLTRPVAPVEPTHLEPIHLEPSHPEPQFFASGIGASAIGAAVGARFTMANAVGAQTLEVVDIRELTAGHGGRAPSAVDGRADAPAKLLLVSCRIVDDGPAGPVKPGSATAVKLVRFIVDADASPPVRLPRQL